MSLPNSLEPMGQWQLVHFWSTFVTIIALQWLVLLDATMPWTLGIAQNMGVSHDGAWASH